MISIEQIAELNVSIQLLEANITEFGGDANCLNFISQHVVTEVMAIDHYFPDDQGVNVPTNHLFNLFVYLITLSQTIKTRLNQISTEDKNIYLNVLQNGIELTRLLTEEYFKAYVRPSAHLARDYEDALQKLGEVIRMTDAAITVSHQAGATCPKPTVKKFLSSISQLQNLIEARSDRFMREHPYLTAFVSSALTAVGICMFLASLLILPAAPLIFAATAVLSVAGIVVLSIGLAGLVVPIYEKCKQSKDPQQLFEQTTQMASSLRAVTKTSGAFFLPKASWRKSNVSNSSSSSALNEVNRPPLSYSSP